MKTPPPKLLSHAKAGDAESQYALAAMYGAGDRLPKNDEEAAKWYRAAAERGHVEAQWNFGLMCLLGEGVPKNPDEGVFWITTAATSGSVDAIKALASAYSHGLYGLDKNLDLAELWLARLSEKE